jgi:O-antigen/teichoic acid export membrane protein
MLWNLANTIFSQVVTIVIFIFLTYKLEAHVFGVFALGVLFVDFFWVAGRSACADSAMQQNRFDQIALDTIAWSTAGIYLLVVAILCLITGLVAKALNEPMLLTVMPALALSLLFVPPMVPCDILLFRRHDFRGVAIRNILSTSAGAISALVVAFSAYPEWALVAQRAGMQVVAIFVMFFRTGWVPGFHFDAGYARKFLKDSGLIFAAQSLGGAPIKIMDGAVAVFFGTTAVGWMRVASRLIEAVYAAFANPISSLWVILLSAGDQSADERRTIYTRLSQMSALVCVPIFTGLTLVSTDLVAIALKPSFQPAGVFLALLSAAGILAPLAYFRNGGLIANKRYRYLIVLSIIDITLLLLLVQWLAPYGMYALVSGVIIVEVMKSAASVHTLTKAMNTPWISVLRSIYPAYLAALAMTIAVLGLAHFTEALPALARLAAKASIGAIVYAGYLIVFHRAWTLSGVDVIRHRPSPGESSTLQS